MRVLAAVCVALALAGCAQRSDSVTAAYVSPVQYQSFTCQQLKEEAARVAQRAAIAAGQQDQSATNDAIATGVAVIVFFPAAFLIHGNGVNAQELAELKGDMDAIQQANIQKNCGIRFQQSPAPTQ
jgi:hypothetical protein